MSLDVATHFTPRYRPWRQRIAFIPDGDLFQAVRAGKVSVVTDEIDRFTPTGILLKSGKVLEADIIVTATGFNLNVLGDFVCRLLNHMQEKGAQKVTPTLRPEDKDMPSLPWIAPENFNPGYLTRSMHLLPKQGDKPEWQHTQDYWSDKDQLPAANLDDGALVYE